MGFPLSYFHLLASELQFENKMDNKGVRSLAIITYLMVFGMLLGQSTASFKSCYESCFLLCVITPHHSVGSCSFKCLKDCIIPTSYSTNTDNQYFCKLGCASSLCSSFSTKQNPGNSIRSNPLNYSFSY